MQSAVDRRQRIIELLHIRRHEKVDNFAFEFQVCRRTIERDLQVLACSYPLNAKKGKGGCVYVEEGFDLYKQYLSEKQTNVLEKLLKETSGDDAATIQSILNSFGRRKKHENDQ